jgi:hypothetical protein
VRDLVFQSGKSRIFNERRQTGKEARRINPGGAIVARPVERREGFVVVSPGQAWIAAI